MGKPSITNIKPPSSTSIWTPPKTTWDLNLAADITAAGSDYANHYNTDNTENTAFDTLAAKINTSTPTDQGTVTDVDAASLTNTNTGDGVVYSYVFLGVNGGENETVFAKDNSTGIIETGNGKDTIVGEFWSMGDQKVYEMPADTTGWVHHTADSLLIFAGNGADTLYGSAKSDILFGENGPDQLHGNADQGTASFTTGGSTYVVKSQYTDGGNNDLLKSLPAQGSATTPDAGDNGVRKVGDYIALDAEGHPTGADNDPNGNPYVHNVWSFTPNDGDSTQGETINYTVAYYRANQLDGGGDPNPDYFAVSLTEGQKYYFSFTNYDGNPSGQIEVKIFLTSDLNGNPPPSPLTGNQADPIATSQAMPTSGWDTYFDKVTTDPTLSFTAGDQLIGGNGPDTFYWDASDHNNVDLVWDYDQGGDAYDHTEGDKLVLQGIADHNGDHIVDKADLTVFTDVTLDADGDKGLVIYVGDNQAIGLVGITSLDQVDVTFA